MNLTNFHVEEVQKHLNYDWNKPLRYLTVLLGLVWALVLWSFSSQVTKALEVIHSDAVPTVVHDTVFVKAPTIYYCWSCNKELKGIHEHPVQCCEYTYVLSGTELLAKKR